MLNEPIYSRRRFGAAAIGAGAGAVALTTATPAAAQAAPSAWWINVKDHGAQGNGIADDTAAIQQAINDARTAGGGIVVLPAGTYRITASLSLTDPAAASSFPSVSLQGVGPHASTILVDTGTYPDSAAVQAFGRDGTKHMITGTLGKGARSVTVPTGLADELNPGDVVGFEATGPKVFGPATAPSANPRELHRVTQKQGSTIWIDSPLMFDYSTDLVGWRMFTPRGITVRDLGFQRTADTMYAYSIRFQKAADVAVERVTMTNAGGGLLVHDVVDGHLSDITADRLPQVANNVAPFGYGVTAAGGTANLTVNGLVGRWCRHVFTTLSDQRGSGFWGGPRDIVVVGGIGEGGPGSKAIWDTHEWGKNISFVGCLARGATDGVGQPETGTFPGFQIRAHDVLIADCVATYCGANGVRIAAVADNVTVQGGELAFNGASGIGGETTTTRIVDAHIHDNGTNGIAYWQTNTTASIHILGCHIHDNGKAGVPKAAIHHNTTQVRSAVIVGNIIPYSSLQTISCLGLDAETLVIANNVLLGYGSGELGDYLTTGGIKSFNTVDP